MLNIIKVSALLALCLTLTGSVFGSNYGNDRLTLLLESGNEVILEVNHLAIRHYKMTRGTLMKKSMSSAHSKANCLANLRQQVPSLTEILPQLMDEIRPSNTSLVIQKGCDNNHLTWKDGSDCGWVAIPTRSSKIYKPNATKSDLRTSHDTIIMGAQLQNVYKVYVVVKNKQEMLPDFSKSVVDGVEYLIQHYSNRQGRDKHDVLHQWFKQGANGITPLDIENRNATKLHAISYTNDVGMMLYRNQFAPVVSFDLLFEYSKKNYIAYKFGITFDAIYDIDKPSNIDNGTSAIEGAFQFIAPYSPMIGYKLLRNIKPLTGKDHFVGISHTVNARVFGKNDIGDHEVLFSKISVFNENPNSPFSIQIDGSIAANESAIFYRPGLTFKFRL